MDIYEPIRDFLLFMSNEEKPTDKLDKSCGIISSCYPPTEMYPEGQKVEYKFPIKPKDLNFFSHVKFE